MKKMLLFLVIGAAVAYLFDPDTGSRRRDALRKRLDEMGVTSAGSSTGRTGPTSIADYTPSSVATIP